MRRQLRQISRSIWLYLLPHFPLYPRSEKTKRVPMLSRPPHTSPKTNPLTKSHHLQFFNLWKQMGSKHEEERASKRSVHPTSPTHHLPEEFHLPIHRGQLTNPSFATAYEQEWHSCRLPNRNWRRSRNTVCLLHFHCPCPLTLLTAPPPKIPPFPNEPPSNASI